MIRIIRKVQSSLLILSALLVVLLAAFLGPVSPLFAASGGQASKTGTVKSIYIVVMKDASLARYSGGLAGYPATSLKATGKNKLNASAPESARYLAYLESKRTATINAAAAVIGRDLDISFEYGATIVGFAAEMTAKEVQQIEGLSEVAFIELEKVSVLHTDAGPSWSGAESAWGGPKGALTYLAGLYGSSEVPAVNSTASGTGSFSYDKGSKELSYEITVTNPGALQLTSMHIHQAEADANGNVVHNLNLAATSTGFTETGSVTLSDFDELALVNGQLYINVHSTANPNGEIRGQILLNGTMGEGIIVGIIDSGIDPWNPSFLAIGDDGYEHTNPLGSGNYVGVCDPSNPEYDATFLCNDKLIGAYGYPSVSLGNARDFNGHGSHTASTAAGNFVYGAEIDAPTGTFSADISGVAPHANIIAYNACCTGAALAAAREQALLDGVDVINYSIGRTASTGDFWQDSESLQWLALRESGIFVATSNGNSGNADFTTGAPADVPWITSVGASSHSRVFAVTLELTDSNSATATVTGQSLTTGYGPAEVIFSNAYVDTEDTRLCAPGAFAPGTFSGQIVICERGLYSRTGKGQSVLDGGAGGFVLAQPDEPTGGPGSVATDVHVLPAVHIEYSEYQILRQFMLTDAVGTVIGTLSDAVSDTSVANGDIMASFSSRGPNGTDADLIVPSVTAPGRAIFAAYRQGDAGDGDFTFNIIQGTSMSSPHTAGAGALLTALHPDWTPAEMQSALMMTALTLVQDDDGVTQAGPFDQGAGHIWISDAVKSALVMDITRLEYDAADPEVDNGFGVRDLNTASLGDDDCIGACRWTRTVRNTTNETLTWYVNFSGPAEFVANFSPDTFTLAPGQTQQIDIELDVSAAPATGEWNFGTVWIEEHNDSHPKAHWPVAVVPKASNLPKTLDIVTDTKSGGVEMNELKSAGIDGLQLSITGLIEADRTVFTLTQDNNLGVVSPERYFDAGSPTEFVAINVPADTFSVIAEVVETTSPDVDILLFLDADANGPDVGDVGDVLENPNACISESASSEELCEIFSPVPGTYYVAVLNFTQGETGGDNVDLATAVIVNGGVDEGNLGVSGPLAWPAGTPFFLSVLYSKPDMTAIEKLYGYFSVGSNSANPDDLGKVRVSLEYRGVPDIAINPTELTASVDEGATLTENLELTSTDGVLNWTVLSSSGTELVQDGGFEQGYAANPHWQAGATVVSDLLPICSFDTCGSAFATQGDWFLWMGGAPEISAFAEQTISITNGGFAELSFKMLMGFVNPNDETSILTVSVDATPLATFTAADLPDFSGDFATVTIDISQYADGGDHLLRFDFENPSTENVNMFIDEVSVLAGLVAERCRGVGAISWLDVSPSSGILSPGQVDLAVTYSGVGLPVGTYTDNLCVSSNDPDEPFLSVPVLLNVEFKAMFEDGFE